MTLIELNYYFRKFMTIAPFLFIFGLVSYIFILKVVLPNLPGTVPVREYNPIFGKLKPIEFSYKLKYPNRPEYILENIKGRPETSTDAAKIYFFPKLTRQITYQQNIMQKARRVGFDTDIEQFSDIENDIATIENNQQKLEVNVNTYNFKFRYKYELFPTIFDNPAFPKEEEIVKIARDFLSEMGNYYPDLARGKPNRIYLNYDRDLDTFNVVKTPDQANVVEVDFFRDDFSPTIPFVSPKFYNSQNFVVMTFGPEGYRIIKAETSFFDYDRANIGLYPIKDGKQAWAELKQGKGIIVSADKTTSEVIITQMYLAYYDIDSYQEHLQPVYVFLGENRFAAYIPAVIDEYLQ